MKCNEMKARIKYLENQNTRLSRRIVALNSEVVGMREQHKYPFNELDIIVEPRYNPIIEYDIVKADLRVIGYGDVPTVITTKVFTRTALELILERYRGEFIRRIGETMAAELLQFGESKVL